MAIYKDISFNFDALHPITKDIGVLTDYSAIKQSVKNLILTDINEIPFERKKGSLVKWLLFENITPIVKIETKQYIEDVLYAYEPRVNLIDVDIQDYGNEIQISIYYEIVGENKEDQLNIKLDKVK